MPWLRGRGLVSVSAWGHAAAYSMSLFIGLGTCFPAYTGSQAAEQERARLDSLGYVTGYVTDADWEPAGSPSPRSQTRRKSPQAALARRHASRPGPWQDTLRYLVRVSLAGHLGPHQERYLKATGRSRSGTSRPQAEAGAVPQGHRPHQERGAGGTRQARPPPPPLRRPRPRPPSHAPPHPP